MASRAALLFLLTALPASAQYLNVSAWGYTTPDLGGYRELKVGLRWEGLSAGGVLQGTTTGTSFVWVDFNLGYEALSVFPEVAAPYFAQPDAQIFSASSVQPEVVMPVAPGVSVLAAVEVAGYQGLNWYFQPQQLSVMGQIARGIYPSALYGTPVQLHVITYQEGELSGNRWWYRMMTTEL